MRALALSIWLAGALAAVSSAAAQEIPKPSFLDRGLDGLLGKSDRPAGAYASPSASELLPVPGEVGVHPPRALERFDPIKLPEAPFRPAAPAINLPGLPAYAPPETQPQDLIHSRRTLVLEARLSPDGKAIPIGLSWHLFSPIPTMDGKLPLVASASGGTATFEVPPGSYFLHVGFGRAGVTKRVDFTGVQTHEVIVLDAGGLKLSAVAGDRPIPPDKLTFDIYDNPPDVHQRKLIANDVPAQKVVRLNAGTYHVVSNYGSVNAVISADIRVEAGKITEATIQHRAALLTMKLVREKGGEAIADTAWSVSNASGDVVGESVGAFPSMVLSAGDYMIVAKNKDRIYERDFTVKPGVNTDVEVLTSDLVDNPTDEAGSGD